MKNPWRELPDAPPYVLPDDKPFVDAFNQQYGTTSGGRYRLDLELFPHPFLGNREAPVVVLNLNPGIGANTKEEGRKPYAEAVRAGIASEREPAVHLAFTPLFDGTGLGDWWRRSFKEVLEMRSLDELASNVLSVEFHGYHSKGWRAIPVTLPSQRYGFWLVETAISRGATIVLMRGVRAWSVAIPRLADYPGVVRTRTARSSRISPGNCGPEGFAKVLEALGTSQASEQGLRLSAGR